MRKIGILAFALVLLLCGVGSIRTLYAQATTGYTKLNTTPISGTTFTTGALVDGGVYNFEVTAQDAHGQESVPSNIVTGVVPATGTHTATVTWTASVTPGVTYNVYDQLVPIPNSPAATSVTIN
jgi:hypothetical protein